MANFLIFRTDRIGDFITSQVVTNSINQYSTNNNIDLVVSKYNFNYIKNFKYIKNIYVFDKTGIRIFDYIRLLLKIKKNYDYLIVLDGKRRSFLSGILINSRVKICFLKDFYPKFLINLFYDKYIKNSELNIQHKNFEILLNYLDIKIPNIINYYDKYRFKTTSLKVKKPYLHLHLDEKWFEGYYYNDFDYMNLDETKIYKLLVDLSTKFKKNIVITQGYTKVSIMKNFKSKFFSKMINKIKVKNNYVYFFDTLNFRDLENVVKNCDTLICCEGAISHVSNSLHKRTIILYQKNNYNSAKFWTGHMKLIRLLPREDIKKVTKKILLLKI